MRKPRDPLGPGARQLLGGDVLSAVITGGTASPSAAPPAAAPSAGPPEDARSNEKRSTRPRAATKRTSRVGQRLPTSPKKDPIARREQKAADDGGARVAISIRFPAEVAERTRNAAYWTRKTLTDLVLEGLAKRLEELERANGGAFEPRERELPPGRRLS